MKYIDQRETTNKFKKRSNIIVFEIEIAYLEAHTQRPETAQVQKGNENSINAT